MLFEVIVGELLQLAESLASQFVEDGRRALLARDAFAVALSGGSVATTFYPALARTGFDWSRTHLFWADERAVPPDDPESNYGVARRLWLEPAGVPVDRVHRMPSDVADLERAAADYSDALVGILGTPPALDLALLGVGPDGHVASLFPGHALLREERRWVAAVTDAPKAPPRRLTLTLPTLAGAARVLFAAMGQAKAQVVREALEDADSQLPVALVARRARQVVFLLDPEAASALRR